MKIVDVKGHVGLAESYYMSLMLNNKFSTPSEDPTFCLHFGSTEGSLGRWVNEVGIINSSGTIYEDKFGNDDIEAALVYLSSEFPTRELTLYSEEEFNCGDVVMFSVKNGTCSRKEVELERQLAV